ncbi:MAG TPA: SAM-dependent methyltransferase, partial [Geobacteraceae bacterium]|nr:SAM-dependent methyltransferase [Geobacteraceae bacterium]
RVKPFLDDTLRGVFATRAPRRPNPIGLSVVRLTRVEGTTLYIEGVDIIDGTPLLDIKPYIPQFDDRRTDRIGWLSEKVGNVYDMKADERFK